MPQHVEGSLEKTDAKTSPLPPPFPHLLLLTTVSRGMGYPFGQLSGLRPFPASCALQPTLKKKSLDFVFLQAIAKTQCVVDTVLVANSNRSAIGTL